MQFQSTLPSRGATSPWTAVRPCPRYFNPRSPRGERRLGVQLVDDDAAISIHAPLAGSDSSPQDWFDEEIPISIHAPLAGSDPPSRPAGYYFASFQSTLPSRGATAEYTKSVMFD